MRRRTRWTFLCYSIRIHNRICSTLKPVMNYFIWNSLLSFVLVDLIKILCGIRHICSVFWQESSTEMKIADYCGTGTGKKCLNHLPLFRAKTEQYFKNDYLLRNVSLIFYQCFNDVLSINVHSLSIFHPLFFTFYSVYFVLQTVLKFYNW